MERIVKRFLLHNNREAEDTRESDFDELKQDVQSVRVELLKKLRHMHKDTAKYIKLLHDGVSMVGDSLFGAITYDMEMSRTFQTFKSYSSKFDIDITELSGREKYYYLKRFHSDYKTIEEDEVENIEKNGIDNIEVVDSIRKIE